MEKTYGGVFEYDVETGIVRALTHHFYHDGFTRALYLSNGEILLSVHGPSTLMTIPVPAARPLSCGS